MVPSSLALKLCLALNIFEILIPSSATKVSMSEERPSYPLVSVSSPSQAGVYHRLSLQLGFDFNARDNWYASGFFERLKLQAVFCLTQADSRLRPDRREGLVSWKLQAATQQATIASGCYEVKTKGSWGSQKLLALWLQIIATNYLNC